MNSNIREWVEKFGNKTAVRYDTLYNGKQVFVSNGNIGDNPDMDSLRAWAENEIGSMVDLSKCTRPKQMGNSN